MGLVFATLFVISVVVVVRSLRLRGCFWFATWMIVGMGITWLALQFITETWRV